MYVLVEYSARKQTCIGRLWCELTHGMRTGSTGDAPYTQVQQFAALFFPGRLPRATASSKSRALRRFVPLFVLAAGQALSKHAF